MSSTDDAAGDLRRDHVAALNALRYAKNVFLCLAILSVLSHLGSWYLVRHSSKLDALRITVIDASSLGDGAAATVPTEEETITASRWRKGAESALTLAGFVGRVSLVMVVGLYGLCLLVSLSARLGGSAGMARACVWSMLAMAMLVPWERLTPDESAGVPAAFYLLDELERAAPDTEALAELGEDGGPTSSNWMDTVRYCIYPGLLGVVLVLGQLSFRSGHRKLTTSPSARLPMREV